MGNAIFPLLELHPRLYVYAFDFAKSAIELLKTNPLYEQTGRCEAYVCDLVRDELPPASADVDLALCMFCLSALHPNNHPDAFRKLFRQLRPGGKLLMRDYGRYAVCTTCVALRIDG